MTAYEIFVNKRQESNPRLTKTELRLGSFSIWKRMHRSGKFYYEKLAKEHNQSLGLPKQRSEDTVAKEEPNPINFLEKIIQ